MDDHKRHGSPTLVEGNSVLLRKNNDTAGELCFGGENTLLSVKIDEDIKSGVVGNNNSMGCVPGSCTKVKLKLIPLWIFL